MAFKTTALAALMCCILASSALAEIVIKDAYFRSASPKARAGAAFMLIENTGSEPDRLVAAFADFAAKTELHTHEMTDGVMKMVLQHEGFVIAPGETRALKRGGDHVMMMGLTGVMADDVVINITLEFEKAGKITVDMPMDRSR